MSLHSRVINLLYPPACALCQASLESSAPPSPRAANLLCAACRRGLVAAQPPACLVCGQALSGAFDARERCRECLRRPRAFVAARAPWQYCGALPQAIQAFKYRRRWRLGRWLAADMADTARRALPLEEIDAILPVPLHWLKRWVKGFNPAEHLAADVARAIGKPLLHGAVRRVRWTASQTRLEGRARRRNVARAFAASPRRVAGSRVLLVDDVMTSTATAHACAGALTRAGARHVFVLTATRTPLR